MKRGEIYLINFGKKYNSEFGKVRPALIAILKQTSAYQRLEKYAIARHKVAGATSSFYYTLWVQDFVTKSSVCFSNRPLDNS